MKFNADQFRERLGKKHQVTEIEMPSGEVVVLRNPMRMTRAERKRLNEIFDSWRERFPREDEDDEGRPRYAADAPKPEEEDVAAHLSNVLTALIANPVQAERFLSCDLGGQGVALRDDLASMDYLLEVHGGGDLGEGSPSQD